jgi:hypothetical protein
MGIISDDDATRVDNKPDQPNNNTQAGTTTFAGSTFTGSAPTGAADFLGLRSMIILDQADGTVEPYLEEVLKQAKTKIPNLGYEKLQNLSNTYAYSFEGDDGYVNAFGLLFVSMSELVSQKMIPASMRLEPLLQELRDRYAKQDKKIRLADARVIIVDYAPDMERTFQMAATIVRTFNVTSIPAARNATIDSLVGTEFAINWSLTEARKLERQLSPHGVPPRMDFGATINAKIQHQFGRNLKEYEVDYQPLAVIGGYVEIRGREMFTVNGQQRLLYRPVVMITVNNAVIPLEGVGAIALAAIAPAIYNSLWWASQWNNLGENEPQPGLLEEDAERPGHPYILKSKEEVKTFIETYFATPEIAVQYQDGRDVIPGMHLLADPRPDHKNYFGERLTKFFGAPQEDLSNVIISQVIEHRSDGVYGEPNGTLHDSRDVDYLYIAAKNGVSSIAQHTRDVLIKGSENPAERAQIVADITGSFNPLFLNTIAAVNADFIKGIIRMTQARGLTIVDPNSQMEARPFGSFITGFGSSTGISSIVSNGFANRGGAGLSSVWQF